MPEAVTPTPVPSSTEPRKRRKQHGSKLVQRQSALLRLSSTIVEAQDEREICERVVNGLHDPALGYDRLSLFMLNESTGERSAGKRGMEGCPSERRESRHRLPARGSAEGGGQGYWCPRGRERRIGCVRSGGLRDPQRGCESGKHRNRPRAPAGKRAAKSRRAEGAPRHDGGSVIRARAVEASSGRARARRKTPCRYWWRAGDL